MLLRHLELTALGSDVANCILLACEQLDPARLDKQKKKKTFQGKKNNLDLSAVYGLGRVFCRASVRGGITK